MFSAERILPSLYLFAAVVVVVVVVIVWLFPNHLNMSMYP